MNIAQKLTAVAENEQRVFDAGKTKEWSDFWDNFQNYGKRTDYSNALQMNWNENNFKPKYDLNFVFMDACFKQFNVGNLSAHLENLGVSFNSSRCTGFGYGFYMAKCTRIPEIDVTSGNDLNWLFHSCWSLGTIDKIVLKSTGTNSFTETFTNCSSLKNITFEGVIGRSIKFTSNVLTVSSAKNIIEHLADYAGTENENKYTLKLSETVWTKLEADCVSPAGTTWREYVQSMGWLV